MSLSNSFVFSKLFICDGFFVLSLTFHYVIFTSVLSTHGNYQCFFFFNINDFVFHSMFIFGSFPQMQYYVFCMFSFHPFFEYTPSAKTSLGCSVLYHSQSIHFSFVLFMFFLYFLLLFTSCFGYTCFLLSPPQTPKGVICLIWGFSLAFSWRGAPNGAPYFMISLWMSSFPTIFQLVLGPSFLYV